MQTHRIRSGVVMDIAAFKVSHSIFIDKDTAALRAAKVRSSSIGAMDESAGKVMQAHNISGVVMDTAAFKVSHSSGTDSDATALQAKKRST